MHCYRNHSLLKIHFVKARKKKLNVSCVNFAVMLILDVKIKVTHHNNLPFTA